VRHFGRNYSQVHNFLSRWHVELSYYYVGIEIRESMANKFKKFNHKTVIEIMRVLDELYPNNKTELNYETPFQLLVATILSAQATDKKVNEITLGIYDKYKTPYDFAKLKISELEQLVKQINYYKTKAKHIIEMSEAIVTNHNGEVPIDRNELMKLAGVGRKTANVVMSYAFNIPAIAVDTHVFRVANRIGLVNCKDVLQTELELEKIIPKEWWSKAHTCLVLHGRRICDARKPKCDVCTLNSLCNYHKYSSK